MRTREGYEAAGFEEVEDGKAEEWRDDADMASPVEAVSELYAAVAVCLVGCAEGLEDSQFNATSISVLMELRQTSSSKDMNGVLTFGTARMIFTATSLRVRTSSAFTTLPNVPWPSNCNRLYRSPNRLFSWTM